MAKLDNYTKEDLAEMIRSEQELVAEMYELLKQLRYKIVQEGIQDIPFAAMFSEEVVLIDNMLKKARGE